MSDLRRAGARAWEWSVASRALPGEQELGDLALIAPAAGGTLVAVVDGLGHGREAALAARKAVETIEAAASDDLPELARRCHDALRRTRGAVISIALVTDDGTLTWAGIGNVEAVVLRADSEGPVEAEHALLTPGVLGMDAPQLRPTRTALAPGDLLVLATDGVSASFVDDLSLGTPEQTAEAILERHATGRDDALVLVGKFGRARA